MKTKINQKREIKHQNFISFILSFSLTLSLSLSLFLFLFSFIFSPLFSSPLLSTAAATDTGTSNSQFTNRGETALTFWDQAILAGKNLSQTTNKLLQQPDVALAKKTLTEIKNSLEKSLQNLGKAKLSEGQPERQKYFLILAYSQLNIARSQLTRVKLQLSSSPQLTATSKNFLIDIESDLKQQIEFLDKKIRS